MSGAGRPRSRRSVWAAPRASNATVSGSALPGSNYTGASGTLTFAPGQTSKTVHVNVVGETVVEANETFAVNLFAPTRATLFDSQGLDTIRNDD